MNKKTVLLLILLGVIYRIATLDAYGLWLDEARQFWVSKGVRAAPLGSIDFHFRDTRLISLFTNTYKWLLGSVFFTLFIHYWSAISNSTLWLRIIPCLFGIGVLPLMYFIAIACDFSKKWALVIVAFCAWNAPWVYYSRELRPYSFEIFCAAFTLLLFIKILKNKNASIIHYAGLVLAILVGIFSGYGYNVYYPFVVVFLIFYVMVNNKGSKAGTFFKVSSLIVPIVVSLCYIHMSRNIKVPDSTLVQRGYQATLTYLPYLCNYSYNNLWSCIIKAGNLAISCISWQIFNVKQIRYPFLNALPLGLPFLIISWLFFICSIFILLTSIKRKNITEGGVLAMFIYLIVIGIALSAKGLYPIGPIRQGLFFSPVSFISFFICGRHVCRALEKAPLKIKENCFVVFLLILLLTPNILREYKVIALEKNLEEMRPLLKNIQNTISKNDKICVSINAWGMPVFAYEREYSNIPWLKRLKSEAISRDLSFRAGADSGYGYQWYIFSGKHGFEIEKNKTKNYLKKECNIIIDKEYAPSPKTVGFRVKRAD